ncbi:hypothetical protein [Micromonospora sp. NPDC048839]|uniref:hypothetical protein n=1 Tax=Micromonospora sp. NPDC048839 TaxID=3155641 RepID=UPI0033F9D802
MQPESPYRYTHLLGGCQVGKAWAAVDGQGQFATVAVLDGVAASDERWRAAFGTVVGALAQADGGHRYVQADLSAAYPWVAYPAEEGNAPQRIFQDLGMDYQPVPSPPISGPPSSAFPISGVPQQVSGPPKPVSGMPGMVEHMPQLPWAVQAAPVSGQPVSGTPSSFGQQVSAVPSSPAYADDVTGARPADPLLAGGRRIAPSTYKAKRPKWPLIAGAVALVLVAGTAGFFVGRGGGEEAAPPKETTLAAYEARQLAINKQRFPSELEPLAEPWLAGSGNCAAYNEPNVPKLPVDERRHLFCNYGNAFMHFVIYADDAPKETARAFRLQLNLAGGTLAPGLRQATRTTGNVTGASGSYMEYAFTKEDGRTMCGIWWDRDDIQGVVLIEALCKEGLDGDWDALRDLWRRGS